MLRLTIAGPDTKLLSSLCAACPYSPAGCCVAPPRLDLSDIGRVVAHGGRDWLLEEIAAKRVAIGERALRLATQAPSRARWRARGRVGLSRSDRMHIPHDRRSPTCNYYLCDAARAGSGPDEVLARETHDDLVAKFIAWDAEITRRVAATWPDGRTFDAAFLDWLGTTFTALAT